MKTKEEKFEITCATCSRRRYFSTFEAVLNWRSKHTARTGHEKMFQRWPIMRRARIAKRSMRKRMRSSRVTGRLPGVRIAPKAGWRKSVDRTSCVCCGRATTRVHLGAVVGTGVVDHLIPARFVTSHFPGHSPEANENLNSLCADGGCHGRKLRAEHMLHAGNWIGFVLELRRLNFPKERVQAAFAYYGLPLPAWEDS